MTLNEIKAKREKLAEILRIEQANKRLEELKILAKEVGASTTRFELTNERSRFRPNAITETEIVHNIQESLQTETMIEMCRIAGRNFGIAVVAAIIALLAMIAAWIAALIN